jgi:hypothetical protein
MPRAKKRNIFGSKLKDQPRGRPNVKVNGQNLLLCSKFNP